MALSKITADSLGANAVTANSLSNTAITTALGFTPANNSSSGITTALGYTPVNKASDTMSGLLTIDIGGSSGDAISVRKGNGGAAVSVGNSTHAQALLEGVAGGGLNIYKGSGTWASPTWNSSLTVSASGYVSTPLNPAFDASGGLSSFTSGDLGSAVQWNANVNRANAFSTSNGRFTAPIYGTYCFWAHSIPQNSNAPSRTKLVKNGTIVYNINSQGARQIRGNDNSNTGFTMWVITLAVNDYVYLNTDTNINTESAYCGFGGWLIG